MPRTCTVCSHRARRKIDRLIVFGKSNRAIAGQFEVSRTSIQRHKQHVAAAIERATEKRELSIGEDILGRLENLYQRGLALLACAERTKKHAACIGYLRELRGILGAFYEVTRETAPQSAHRKVFAADFVAAISEALGYTGKLIPIDANAVPLTAAFAGGDGHGEIDTDLLPQD